MDEAFIVVTVISSLFGILGLLILDRNWFRRERFKHDMDYRKKEESLRFKKLARDLGLDTKSPAFRGAASSPMDMVSSFLPLLKNLDADKLGSIAGILGNQESEESEEEPFGGMKGLVDFAMKNPDLVKGFLSKMPGKEDAGESQLL